MPWTSDYRFADPLLDLRSEPEQAERLRMELLRESSPGHVLYGLDLRVIARALPQDEVIVETTGDKVALVHLTWSVDAQAPTWPITEILNSADVRWIHMRATRMSDRARRDGSRAHTTAA